jgi:hypothetical protein
MTSKIGQLPWWLWAVFAYTLVLVILLLVESVSLLNQIQFARNFLSLPGVNQVPVGDPKSWLFGNIRDNLWGGVVAVIINVALLLLAGLFIYSFLNSSPRAFDFGTPFYLILIALRVVEVISLMSPSTLNILMGPQSALGVSVFWLALNILAFVGLKTAATANIFGPAFPAARSSSPFKQPAPQPQPRKTSQSANVRTPPPSRPQDKPTSSGNSLSTPISSKCSSCGTPMMKNMKYCPSCGAEK